MSEIAAFEKFLVAELKNIGAVATCVGGKIYNSVAPPSAKFPFLIFTVIPLDDRSGQAGFSIQTRLLCDIKIVSDLPLPASVDAAVAAIKTKFGNPETFTSGSFRIAVRHGKPISFAGKGATPSEQVMNRGGTYRIWIS